MMDKDNPTEIEEIETQIAALAQKRLEIERAADRARLAEEAARRNSDGLKVKALVAQYNVLEASQRPLLVELFRLLSAAGGGPRVKFESGAQWDGGLLRATADQRERELSEEQAIKLAACGIVSIEGGDLG